MDTVKLVLSILILGVGVFGFYHFEAQALWIRLLGLLVVTGVAVFVAIQTRVGRNAWQFASDSRTEVRKVVWPTRQETLQTLLIIVVAVLVTALFLWIVDRILFEIVQAVTGQGG